MTHVDPEYQALVRARPPASPGQSGLVWLGAYAGVVITIVSGVIAYFAFRSLATGWRVGLLTAVGLLGLLVAQGLSRFIEDYEARRSGLVLRWTRWWAAVETGRGRCTENAAIAPTFAQLPKSVRRWLARPPRPG
jgi:hypothetical protein